MRTRSSGRTDLSREEVQKAIDAVGGWWHSIELADGLFTPGGKSPEVLQNELAGMQLPNLRGKTVLDIGAWDGFFSFTAERLGAKRVVALDHYVWSFDNQAYWEYINDCKAKGVKPQPYHTIPSIWRPDTLPGKRGFDTAHRILGSKVDSVVGDIMTIDLDQLGTFDVVLFLGVLYHMEDPVAAMRRVAQVARDLVVMETAASCVPGYEEASLWEFYPTTELGGDPTNWWAPNAKALRDVCEAAGFSEVNTFEDKASLAQLEPGNVHPYRLMAHARK